MPSHDDTSSSLTRRDVLKSAAVAGIATTVSSCQTTLHGSAETQAASGLIATENAKRGTDDWQLTYTRVDPATRYRCPWIEGYVSKASLRAGESLDLTVSTNPPAPFQVDIYRLGYYGGLGGCHYMTLGPFDGKVQPDPPIGPERLRECQWESCTTITIPKDWVSGVYLGKLSLLKGREQSYVIFIVRDDRKADVLFQCSDNTWQAYNRWPSNFALYDDGKYEWALKPGIRVSYDRPYGKYCQILDAPLSQGSGEFLLWEFPMAFWLEREGYDVTYCSNTDVHADLGCITRARAMFSVGHDEYWSLEQFNNVKAARDAGVNLAFFSGDTCCFVSPFSPSATGQPHRTFTREGRYGGLTEKEKSVMGPFPMEGPNEATLMGARTTYPYNGSGDWIVTDASNWIFDGLGVKNGDRVQGLVGWECHGDPAQIEGLKIVAQGETINTSNEKAWYTATVYPGPKGNWVFNAATIWWSEGLSVPPGHIPPYSHFGRPHGPNKIVEGVTRNLLKRFLA